MRTAIRVLALLIGLASACAHGASPERAPAWTLRTPDGQTVRFPQDMGGQPTVLMFWPSWCPFSRALQPYVQDIWRDYRDRGVSLWTINIREDGDPVQTLKDRGLELPLLLQGDPLMRTYGIEYTPWLVVIDRDQRIVYTRPRNPPTPIETAKEVRALLNTLVGPQRAMPMPTTWAKPYDLHLKKKDAGSSRLAPAPMATGDWKPWVEQYLAGVDRSEAAAGIGARGPVADGKAAIALAREAWTAAFGADETLAQAPYRAYRKDDLWIVLGKGDRATLGEGFVLVVEASSGRVLRSERSAR